MLAFLCLRLSVDVFACLCVSCLFVASCWFFVFCALVFVFSDFGFVFFFALRVSPAETRLTVYRRRPVSRMVREAWSCFVDSSRLEAKSLNFYGDRRVSGQRIVVLCRDKFCMRESRGKGFRFVCDS